MSKATRKSNKERIALSYMNVGHDYEENGDVTTDKFFFGKTKDVDWMQACLDQLIKGGVKLIVGSVGVNDTALLPGSMGVDILIRYMTSIRVNAAKSNRCMLVETKKDLLEAEKKNKLAIVMHMTGASINGSMQLLETYHALGLRSIHPLVRQPEIGGHWNADPKLGLTDLGKELIREMLRLNMLVDTAHANDKSFKQMVKMADRPIMDSHAGSRVVTKSDRNRSDAQLRAIASTGGVTGVHFASQLLGPVGEDPRRKELILKVREKEAAFRKKYSDNPYAYLKHRYDAYNWSRAHAGAIDDGIEPPRAELSDLINHIEHMADVAGVDHICIGSDYALGNICKGVEHASKLQNLARALKDRGYSKTERDKLLYKNIRRVVYENLPSK